MSDGTYSPGGGHPPPPDSSIDTPTLVTVLPGGATTDVTWASFARTTGASNISLAPSSTPSRRALVRADAANTGTVYVGPVTSTLLSTGEPLTAGAEYLIESPEGTSTDLVDWFIGSPSGAGQVVNVIYV